MLKSVDEKTAAKICSELDVFIAANHAPVCTKLFYKLFYQCYSDEYFSMDPEERLAMERISDILIMLWSAKPKQ